MRPEGLEPTGLRRGLALRLLVYAAVVPLVVVAALDLDRPEPWYATLTALGGVAAIGILATARGRARLARLHASRRAVRVADVVLWNAVLLIAGLEALLALADVVIDHPLLTRPNARARERIENFRLPGHVDLGGGWRTNAGGFNDSEWGPRAAGTLRIAVIGDSFPFGIVGYERNAFTLLEPLLSARLGRPVEVLNLGITGIGTVDYLYVLNDEGLPRDPDAIVLCFFAGNDIAPARSKGSLLRRGNWRLFAMIDRLVRLARDAQGRVASGREPTVSEPFSDAAYLELAVKSYLPVVRRPLGAREVRAYADTLDALEDILDAAERRPVLFAVFPSELQVSAELRARVLATAGVDESAVDLDQPARLIAERFAGRGVPVVDLRPALLDAERAGRTYAERDSHWNDRGNAVVAEALAPPIEAWLRERLLAPAPAR